MAAMNWLATQLAWEQRLGELRSGGRPPKVDTRRLSSEARPARQAA